MKNNHYWFTRARCIVIAILLISNCPACYYFPYIHSLGQRGISDDMLSSIEIGKTKKEDILLTFGCPTEDSESQDGSTFEYRWRVSYFSWGEIYWHKSWGIQGHLTLFKTLRISFDGADTVTSYDISKKSKIIKDIWHISY